MAAALIFFYNIGMTLFTNHHQLTRTAATLLGGTGMLAIALMYTVLPEVSGRNQANGKEGLSFSAFVCLNFSMIFMVMALFIAGIVQGYLQRVAGLDLLEVQEHMRLWFQVRLVAGAIFTVGTVALLWDLFRLARPVPVTEPVTQPELAPVS